MTPWQLVQKIGRLEREADETTCQMVAMATEIDELRAERNQIEAQLDEAGIELSGAREDRRTAEQQMRDRAAELTALRQFKANVCSVSALPPHQAPAAPQPLADRFEAGTPVRLGKSPSWVRDEADTQPVPAATA